MSLWTLYPSCSHYTVEISANQFTSKRIELFIQINGGLVLWKFIEKEFYCQKNLPKFLHVSKYYSFFIQNWGRAFNSFIINVCCKSSSISSFVVPFGWRFFIIATFVTVTIKHLFQRPLFVHYGAYRFKVQYFLFQLTLSLANKLDFFIFHKIRLTKIQIYYLYNEQCIILSFSKKIYPFDNGNCESFFKYLKIETNRFDFHTYRNLYHSVFQYIESYYNSHKPLTSLGFLTPDKMETTYCDRKGF